VSEKMGSSLCLTLDGKREKLNIDFVLSPESFRLKNITGKLKTYM